jgi:ABC-type glycerol-3-phosphate transport system substrate-binding protein
MRSNLLKIMMAVLVLSMVLAACAPATTPEPTTAPAAPTTAAAQPTAAPKPTDAPQPTAVPPTAVPEPTKVMVSNPPTTPEMVDAIDLSAKKQLVIYWHNRPQKDQDLLQSMLDEFNKSNPYGITAEAEIAGASYNDVYSKVSAAIQAGQPPSMSVAYQNQAAFYRGQDAVVDLTPFVNSSKYGLSDADKSDYFQTFLDSDKNPQFKGEILGFPTQRSMEVMYVNMDWLNKLGYTEPPTDWATFEEIACKASQEPDKYGWAFRHDASNFASQVFSRGGQIVSDDGSKYVFDSQAGVDTLKMIQRLFEKKCAIEIPTSERYGEQNRFANGQVLFVFASSSGLPFYADSVTKGANFKWDIAMEPNTGTPAVDLYGASISVYKTTPEQELASWLVIKFLGETAQTAKWAAETGYLPVRKSAQAPVIAAFKESSLWGPVADTYAKMFDWAQYAKIEAPVAGYDPVRALIDTDLMSKVIADPNADIPAMLKSVVEQANAILKENAPQ